MSLNEAIVALYNKQKIDKSTAYQLLSELKSQPRQDTAPEPLRVRMAWHGSEQELLAVWVYFLHSIVNRDDVMLAYEGGMGRRAIPIVVNEDLSFAQLRAQVSEQLRQGDGWSAQESSYAFLAEREAGGRSYGVACRICGDEIELSAAPHLVGVTDFGDWADTLAHLFGQMRAQPDLPLKLIDQLPARHKRLLEEYNRTYAYLPEQRTLGELLVPVLSPLNDQVAVETSAGELRYGDLKGVAYRLAHLLRRLYVQPNQLVAVITSRSPHMPAALLGVCLSGGAYVPLEPEYPKERIKTILKEARCTVLVTDMAVLSRGDLDLADTEVKSIVCLDADDQKTYQGARVCGRQEILRQTNTAPDPVNRESDLCYVIFTSGSTGKPKGVMISHLNIVNTLVGVNNQFRVGAGDKILCFSSYSFDLSVWDMFGAMLAGACVFVPNKDEIKDPRALMAIVRERRITIWDSVPTGMSQLLLPFIEANDPMQIHTLRLAMLSGEFIPLSLPENIRRFFPSCRVSSLGGATEGTVWSIYYYPVDEVKPEWTSIPYGKPLPNQRFHVLNSELKPCAVGKKGELYIGGLGVAQGYYLDEEKTRNAFRPSPWSSDMGPTIYRTGDLGILRADGLIDIVGRADHQVKVRGFRVELGEVESQLCHLPKIEQAAVLVHKDANGGNSLTAFYTSREGELAADVLSEQLAERLPDYMIPSRFVYLKEAPVGATGKLDRKALAAWKVSRDDMSQSFVAPESDEEQTLAEALKKILNIDRVGANDDFFLIGGDSLLALQYLSALNSLGYSASPQHIRRGRTIRGVLESLKKEPQVTTEHQAHVAMGLAPMQRKFMERLPLLNRNHWNQSIVIRFEVVPDVKRLEAALRRIIDHHPLLRAGIEGARADSLRVAESSGFSLSTHDLRGVPFLWRAARYRELTESLQASSGYDAARVCHAMLVKYGHADTRLLWVVNHLVVDAHCWRVLIEDLVDSYLDPATPLRQSSDFSAYIATVARDFPAAENQYAGEWHAAARDRTFRLPHDKADGRNLERDAKRLSVVLTPEETRPLLDATGAGKGISLHLIIFTACLLSLRDWTGQGKVAVDVISNGRDIDARSDFSRTVGWFATHNPFVIGMAGEMDEAVRRVAAAWETHREASTYFVEACNRATGDARNPLQGYKDNAVLYNFLGMYDSLPLPVGWQVLGAAGGDRGSENPRTHEIEIEVMVLGGRLMVQIYYSGAMFRRVTVHRLGRLLQRRLMAFGD